MTASSQHMEEHHQLNDDHEEKQHSNTSLAGTSITNDPDPFDMDYDHEDPFTDPVETKDDNAINLNVPSTQAPPTIMTKQMTLYSTLEELNEPLPLPHKNNCYAKMKYHFETFLAVHPRIYSLYLLYSSTWPRGLVLLDMYTDFVVVMSLYKNNETLWFMLSSLFLVLPFVLVWTVSLRFIQKFINHLYSRNKKNHGKCVRSLVNFALTLYIFPPIGSSCVALYEVYLVLYDIINGIKCFILGTGFVETQTNDVRAMKQYRRAVEIFSESIPQTLLQLWMFVQQVEVSKEDLYRSLAISVFNLVINAYRFRKEAKINGMPIAEYALSVLQLAEIPIVRLVPRLPAIKKGKLEFINFAGFSFDKESITPIIEALSEVRCVLNTMKISIGSLIHLDFESCRLIGRILKEARIRVFISRTFSLLHIKNLFEEIDEDHNGYLDENEFSKALKLLNSGLLHMDKQQQRRIFQKLAIRRIKKRDRVYFYDFFRNAASVTNKTIAFDITQMDFPLHYVFQHLTTALRGMRKSDAPHEVIPIESMEKLYYFCCGLDCFDQIDKSMNNHIFFPIIDTLQAMDSVETPTPDITAVDEFVDRSFHEILESDVVTNNAKSLLEMRNTLFQTDIDETKYDAFVIEMVKDSTYDGLNVFEYCFAFKDASTEKGAYLILYLLDTYLKAKIQYSVQQNDEENQKIFADKSGALYYLYNASKLKHAGHTLLMEMAAKYGLFEVIEFMCKYWIADYTADELYTVCIELLKNEEHQNPETFALVLRYARDNGMELASMDQENSDGMDEIILKTQKNLRLKQVEDQTDEEKLQTIETDANVLRYLEILNEYGFDFSAHGSLQLATKHKEQNIMKHIIELCREKSFESIVKLLNEPDINENTAMTVAYIKLDLVSMELLFQCEEQDVNEVFGRIHDDIKFQKNKHLWIKFIYDIIIGSASIDIRVFNNITFTYEVKKQMHDLLQDMIDRNTLEDDAMPISKAQTIFSSKKDKNSSVMKKIFHFGGIFGKTNKNVTDGPDDSHKKERASFKQMAIALRNAFQQNLSKLKPLEPIKQPAAIEDHGFETITIEDDEEEANKATVDVNTNGPLMSMLMAHDEGGDLSDYKACVRKIENLKRRIHQIHNESDERILSKVSQDIQTERHVFRAYRTYTGHFGKIYSLDWKSDSSELLSASQDGKLLIWNVSTGNKKLQIPLRSAWVMACVFSPSGEYVACGGLDNLVSVFRITDEEGFSVKSAFRELQEHEGYVSQMKFVNDHEILSGSGDGTCKLWDAETRTVKQTFTEHTGDVLCVDVNQESQGAPSLFVTGSSDALVKIWDLRAPEKSIATFKGHQSDVNDAKWFVDTNTVITGSDDATVRLFDMKTLKQMNSYHGDDVLGSVTSIDTSSTGQYIFAGYDEEPSCLGWSSLGNTYTALEHPTRVSCLGVSPDGYALATGCWDKILRIWA